MFTFRVRPENGDEFEVKASTRDVLTWEKTTKGNKSYVDLLREPNLVDYYKICHLAAWRQQLFTGSLKEFEEQHDIDLSTGDEREEQDAEPDPTQQARSSES